MEPPDTTKPKENTARSSNVDRCWHVPVIAGLTAFVATVALSNSGFIYVGLMDLFGINREGASWPSSIIGVMCHLAGVLVAVLLRWMSVLQISILGSVLCWSGMVASAFAPDITWMTITLGGIHGAGIGVILVTLAIVLVMYFDRYRGLANGCKYAGWSVSGLVFPKILSYLEEQYGFRGTLLVLGAISAHVTALALLLREPNWIKTNGTEKLPEATVNTVPRNNETLSVASNSASCGLGNFSDIRTLFRSPMFYVIVVASVVGDFTVTVFSSTIVDNAMDKGASETQANDIIIYASAAELVGRLFIPVLSDLRLLRRSTLEMISFILLGVLLVLLPKVTSFGPYAGICVCIAIFLGSTGTMKAVLMADYLGVHQVPNCHGFVGIAILPLLLYSPSIMGIFRDSRGSYDNVFRMHGGLHLGVGVMFTIVVTCEALQRGMWAKDLVKTNLVVLPTYPQANAQ